MKLLRSVGEWLVVFAAAFGVLAVIMVVAYGVGSVTSFAIPWVRWIVFCAALVLGLYLVVVQLYVGFTHDPVKAGYSISMLPFLAGGFLILAVLAFPMGDMSARLR
ncbi:MAG: hypothetical protein AAFY46_15900, partial [Planctomycetota bacterium]